MNNPKNDEIIKELRRITKLLILIATKDQSRKDQIISLAGLDFQPKEIAELIGTTANTVRVTLARIKKINRGETAAAEKPSS